MFGEGYRPPRGWMIDRGRLEEVQTIAGYAARRCEVHGRCYRRDCRRSCHLDMAELITRGMGELTVRQVQATMRCSRLDGCALEFSERPARRVTLADLKGREYVGVEVRCGGCGRQYVTSIEGFILHLARGGLGDENADVRRLGEILRNPCGSCSNRIWRVEILWYVPGPADSRLPSWKQELVKRRAAAQLRKDIEEGLVR